MEEFFDNLASTWVNHRSNEAISRIYSIVDGFPLKTDDVVLDLACGTGVITERIQKLTDSQVVGIDISSEMINYAKKRNSNSNVTFLKADFYNFKMDYKFDAIVIFDAYPHFTDRKMFMNSALNNLKKGGKIIIAHDLSRKTLDEAHSGNQVNKLSRSLLAPKEEGEFYQEFFDIIEAKEDENSYLLILQKR